MDLRKKLIEEKNKKLKKCEFDINFCPFCNIECYVDDIDLICENCSFTKELDMEEEQIYYNAFILTNKGKKYHQIKDANREDVLFKEILKKIKDLRVDPKILSDAIDYFVKLEELGMSIIKTVKRHNMFMVCFYYAGINNNFYIDKKQLGDIFYATNKTTNYGENILRDFRHQNKLPEVFNIEEERLKSVFVTSVCSRLDIPDPEIHKKILKLIKHVEDKDVCFNTSKFSKWYGCISYYIEQYIHKKVDVVKSLGIKQSRFVGIKKDLIKYNKVVNLSNIINE